MMVTDEAVARAVEALGAHRWKTMGVGTVECECGAIIGSPDDTRLQGFPADEAFREHLARAVLEAAAGAQGENWRKAWWKDDE